MGFYDGGVYDGGSGLYVTKERLMIFLPLKTPPQFLEWSYLELMASVVVEDKEDEFKTIVMYQDLLVEKADQGKQWPTYVSCISMVS